jgi:hypothetical protein
VTLPEYINPEQVKHIAQRFHEVYEAKAPEYGWATQAATRTDYEDLPEANRALMEAVVWDLIEDDYIDAGGRA